MSLPGAEDGLAVEIVLGPTATADTSSMGQHAAEQAKPTIAHVLSELSDNAAAIMAAEEMLQALVAKQASLLQVKRQLEQQHVLAALIQHLGFDKGRPVAAILLYRCFQHWGVLSAEQAPVLDQVASILQGQLQLEDESAQAEVAGLQCHAAYWLTVAAVLFCLILKATKPSLAAAVHKHAGSPPHSHKQAVATAAEVLGAAKRRVGELQQQLTEIGGLQGGLQALGRRFAGWGSKEQRAAGHKQAPAAAVSALVVGSTVQNSSELPAGVHEHLAATAAGSCSAAAAAASSAGVALSLTRQQTGGSSGSISQLLIPPSPTASMSSSAFNQAAAAAAAAGPGTASYPSTVPAPLAAFMTSLDGMVQHCYTMLRDQLKRRLAPLLANCMVNPASQPEWSSSGEVNEPMSSTGNAAEAAAKPLAVAEPVRAGASSVPSGHTVDVSRAAVFNGDSNLTDAAAASSTAHAGSSPSAAAVGGGTPHSPTSPIARIVYDAVVTSRRAADTALLAYRTWSEVVGVLHAAMVALRAAGVPHALVAALMQQVLQFINCQLFNQLLLRPECCSVANARYALRGLKQLDGWMLTEQQTSYGHAEGPGANSTAAAEEDAATVGRHGAVSSQQQCQLQHRGEGAAVSSQLSTPKQVQQLPHPPLGILHAPCSIGAPGGVKQEPTAAVAGTAAAAAKCNNIKEGWESVPAGVGPFDAWQPHQRQQRRGVRQQQGDQQQQQHGDLGPHAWEALSHVRQALQLLALEHKGALTFEDITEHICPALSHQQLYRICTTAWDDGVNADSCVSGEVLEAIKQRHSFSSNGGLIITFMLDEPAEVPFIQHQAEAATSVIAPAGLHGSQHSKPAVGGVYDMLASSSRRKCKDSEVALWDDEKHYGHGMPIPENLVNAGCPASVFSFLQDDQAWPPGQPLSA